MNIFFAINEDYYRFVATTIVSVIENNTEENLNFYIMTSGLSKTAIAYLDDIQNHYPQYPIKYFVISDDIFKRFPLNINYISIETYSRYIIADLIPHESRALYIDADTAVNGNLSQLYHTDISSFYCAGVHDLIIQKNKYKPVINFANEDLYVNAGVLLFNLDKIRQDGMIEKLFVNTLKLADKISYQDQDIINITFKGKIKEIDSIYNFTSRNTKEESKKCKSAVIIHYTGHKKPWHKNCRNKLRKVWRTYNKHQQVYHSEETEHKKNGILSHFRSFFVKK